MHTLELYSLHSANHMLHIDLLDNCMYCVVWTSALHKILKQIMCWLPGEWIIFTSTNPDLLFTTIWTLGELFLIVVFMHLKLSFWTTSTIELPRHLKKLSIRSSDAVFHLQVCYLCFKICQCWCWIIYIYVYSSYCFWHIRTDYVIWTFGLCPRV